MVKGKSKDGGNDGRTDWKEPAKLKAFCDFCAVQVLKGRRSGGFLKKEGVDAVIKELGELGKVVTHTQFKNKWDHLRKWWKDYNECFERETGLGRDPGTGKLDATDEWWTRKIAECPKAGTFKKKGLPNKDSMDIMFGGTVATGKNAFCPSGQIPKESTEGSGDSADSKEFVDPQCQPSVTVDLMDVEGPSLSRAGPADKGKGFASGVHLFRPIGKKPRRKHSFAQDMSESLKSISNVIVESRSISTRTPCASKTTVELKSIMDIVLTLPGVQSGDRLYMFSSLYFMEKEQGAASGLHQVLHQGCRRCCIRAASGAASEAASGLHQGCIRCCIRAAEGAASEAASGLHQKLHQKLHQGCIPAASGAASEKERRLKVYERMDLLNDSSDSEHQDADFNLSDDIVLAAYIAGCACGYYVETYMTKVPLHTNIQTGYEWVQYIINGNEQKCLRTFRMPSHVFRQLCTTLRIGGNGTKRICLEESVAMTLVVLGHASSNRIVQDRFQHSSETVHRHVATVVMLLATVMAADIIQPADRTFRNVPEHIRHSSRYWPHFKELCEFGILT
ncbi:hypothetical protein SO802_001521 [Lithocarpus litseifolius]|uniref:Myb/SANT-like domain-containing protein n=1 Tax=Lithocarpus litseifolius TaxID=425828 RepID=A0AAW2DUM4_9ROSI